MTSWIKSTSTRKKVQIPETNIIHNSILISDFDKLFYDFDAVFYRNNNNLINYTDNELKLHYYNFGRFENRLYNSKIKIIIVSDPWINGSSKFTSGGNMALFNLSYLINNNPKYKDKIYSKMYNFPGIHTKNDFNNNYAIENEINDNTIVIYPDGNEYNPLKAKHVIRWILLEIGTQYRDKHFYKKWSPNDLVYHWQPSKTNIKILNCTFINPLFKYTNSIRVNNSCYLFKKRKFIDNNIHVHHPTDSICIDDLEISDVVKILNTTINFYCYDIKTFIFIGSIICKCNTIIIPYDEYSTKEDFIKTSIFYNFPKFINMFSWGINDISSINYTDNDITELLQYISSLSDTVTSFLDDLWSYIHKRDYDIPTIQKIYYDE